jgi:nucleoside-diphosphate-sugar epimerase
MRVLVTGSRGFVGTWFMAHLAESGDEALELPEDLDILDRQALRAVVQETGADAICHLAAQAAVGRSWQDPYDTFAVNAVGTLNLCSAALGAEPRPWSAPPRSMARYAPRLCPSLKTSPWRLPPLTRPARQRPRWSGYKLG